jgi:hypothetical protein
VWVVPLVVVLWQERTLPQVLRWFGFGYGVWIAAAPFMSVPMGGDLEFTYNWMELLVDDAGIVAGVVFVSIALVTAQLTRNRPRATIVESGELNSVNHLVAKE